GLGPNRVGPQGLLQPAADGLKNILKEETLPAQADRLLFLLAPAISFVPALLTFAVIPFGAPLHTKWGDIPLVVADLPVGFLYILAISSLGVYGITLSELIARIRSEEHTSELQSRFDLVCRLLLEKKKETIIRCCSTSKRPIG